MTKPTIKSSSSSLNQVTRQKIQSAISKRGGSSKLHIKTIVHEHYRKNAPSLDDLAEEAAAKLDQVSNKLKSVLNDLDSLNIYPGQEVAYVSTDFPDSLKDIDFNDLELALQSLGDDLSE